MAELGHGHARSPPCPQAGQLIIIAGVYKGANTTVAKLAEIYASRTVLKLLSADKRRKLFANAGYSDVKITAEPNKASICGIGRKA